MDISRIKNPLIRYHKELARKIRVNQMIVFGSHLEGMARADSDIDIFIISEDFNKMDFDQRWDILYGAAQDIEPDIDAWGFTPKELAQASRLTTLGYAREEGIRFLQ